MKDIDITYLIDICSAFVQDYYDAAGRHYHDFSHIQQMLGRLDEISKFYNQELPPSLILAIIFHDVIYIPGFDKNEEASIQFMKNAVRSVYNNGLEDSLSVASFYIESTAIHHKDNREQNEMGRVFLDLDLLSLTGDLDSVDYDQGIHYKIFLEYTPFLTGENPFNIKKIFAEGRSAFFKEMLKKPKILQSEMYGHLEDSLRKNLQNFIDDPYKYF